MAVPTTDELYAFFAEYTAKHTRCAWAHDKLSIVARRGFRTTTPAVNKQLGALIDEGRLVAVSIGHTGMVFWDDEAEDPVSLPLAYLDTSFTGTSYDKSYGQIVLSKDRKNCANLWANGVRDFYILDTKYAELLEYFREVAEQEKAEKKQKKTEERLALRAALEEVAPQGDGIDLIKALDALLGESVVDVRMFSSMSRPDESYPILSVNIRKAADVGRFLEILRSGLPKAEEQVADIIRMPAQREDGEK
jgi:hypothetical protein